MYNSCEKTTLKRNEFGVLRPCSSNMPDLLDGKFCFDVEGDGNGIILMVDNENSMPVDILIRGSDNVFCGGDKIIQAPATSISYIHLEAAPYVQKTGEYKGKILIEGNGSATFFAVVEIL